MDVQTIDADDAALQQHAQLTGQLFTALADKLAAAAAPGPGDSQIRQWHLDLQQIAVAVQQEQQQAGTLLQSIHTMIAQHVTDQPPRADLPRRRGCCSVSWAAGWADPSSGAAGSASATT